MANAQVIDTIKDGGEGGIRTPGRGFPLRRFSKPLLSTTQPPLREMKMILEASYHIDE